jgi:hypothetical protein
LLGIIVGIRLLPHISGRKIMPFWENYAAGHPAHGPPVVDGKRVVCRCKLGVAVLADTGLNLCYKLVSRVPDRCER